MNGRIYGTPAVSGGRVFVPSSDGDSLTAFTTSGRYLWRVSAGGYVYSSPAVWAGRVYFGSYSGLLYCVSARTGSVQWTVATGGPISGAVVVVDGVAYAGSFAHQIVGVAGRTGRTLRPLPPRRVRTGLGQRGAPAVPRLLAHLRGRAGPEPRDGGHRAVGHGAVGARDGRRGHPPGDPDRQCSRYPGGQPQRQRMRSLLAAAVALVALLAALPAAPAPRPTPAALIEKGLTRAVAAGRLTPEEAATYRADAARARAKMRHLPPLRVQLLKAVSADVAAQWRSYTRPRALALFSTLQVNTDWLAHHALTGSYPDITGDDGAVYRFFSSHGYVFHPLANFAKLNADSTSGDVDAARQLAAALLARAVRSGKTLLWEYEFPWATGRAPWTSGMVQAVAAQALARAGDLLGDPSLVGAASRAYAAVPSLLSSGSPKKPWVALYSFDRTPVLNAQLQAAISVGDYAKIAGNPDAAAMADRLTVAARALLPRFDTGYWSLYSLHGDESTLGYHDYVISLLRKLGTRTGDPGWKDMADRFQAYESEPPELVVGPPSPTVYPRPEDGFRDEATIRFWLSKRCDRHAQGRRGEHRRVVRPRHEHDHLGAPERACRALPPPPDRGRAGGLAGAGGAAAGDRRPHPRAAARDRERLCPGDPLVELGRGGDALAAPARAADRGRSSAGARPRPAGARRHPAPEAPGGALARLAAGDELGRAVPVRVARVPAEVTGLPAPAGVEALVR